MGLIFEGLTQALQTIFNHSIFISSHLQRKSRPVFSNNIKDLLERSTVVFKKHVSGSISSRGAAFVRCSWPYCAGNRRSHRNWPYVSDNVYQAKARTQGVANIPFRCAQALAVNGARVYIVGRREDRLETAAKRYGPHTTGEVIALQGDVTSKEDLARLASEIEAKEKVLHILVNNAGVAGTNVGPQARNVSGGSESKAEGGSGQELRDRLFADNDTFDKWSDIYRTNVTAAYFTSVAFLPLLEKSTHVTPGWSGTIITISSISGITKQSQAHFAYNVSKGAANHLNKMLATELANNKVKIRVNAIAPGVYPSEMTASSSSESTNKSELDKTGMGLADIPSQRPGNDKDMASVCLFLATNQYLNGQVVAVDGGW